MRKTFGAVCMIAGVVLIVGALALLIFNNIESNKAEQSSSKVVSRLKDTITDTADSANQKETSATKPSDSTKKAQLSEVEIDSYSYIGYLSIPSQGLELPIMSQWDYQRLRVAPCRYSGNISDNNMVVIAHNYRSHFGNLDQLEIEEEVFFTDMNGDVTKYEVITFDVVPPTSAEEVVAGDFDLALVTCTYSGKTRFVVYCDEVITY